jgi:RES domain
VASILFPPPRAPIDASQLSLVVLHPGTKIVRIYDPNSRYRPGPRTFRSNGPRLRFDHHRGVISGSTILPADDPTRAVYYGAFTLSGALVEVFGDARVIERGSARAVTSTLRQSVTILDLRGNNAMRAGTIAAIGSTERRDITQAWARWFYDTYPSIGGLLYSNAHNAEDAVALFERSRGTIDTAAQVVARLARADLELTLLSIAQQTGMVVA